MCCAISTEFYNHATIKSNCVLLSELFRLGEDFAFGVLFRSTFKIRESVSALGDAIIERHEQQLTDLYNKDGGQKIVVKPFYIGMFGCVYRDSFKVVFNN
jgi:hypothetical protein